MLKKKKKKTKTDKSQGYAPNAKSINRHLMQLYCNWSGYDSIIFHMFLFAKTLQINANSNAFLFYAMPILLSFYHALCDITWDLHYGLPSASPRGGR